MATSPNVLWEIKETPILYNVAVGAVNDLVVMTTS